MATLLDVWGQTAQLTGAVLEQQDKLNTRIAEQEMQQFQYDFNDKLNNKLLELSQRGDYNNFDGEIESFYNEWEGVADSTLSSDYAKRIVSSYLENSLQQNMYKVKVAQVQAQKNKLLQDTAKYNESLATSDTTLEYAYSEAHRGLANCLAAGAITPEQYTQQSITYYTATMQTKATDAGLNVLKNGGTLKEAEEAVKAVTADRTFKMYDTGEISVLDGFDEYGKRIYQIDEENSKTKDTNVIDYENIENSCLNNVRSYYNTVIAEQQQKNDNRMEELYSKMLLDDPENFQSNLMNMRNQLQSYNAESLPDKRLKYWTDEIVKLEKMSAEGGTTERGNSKIKVESASAIMTNNMPLFVNSLKMNTGDYENIEAAREAWVLYGLDTYKNMMEEAGYDMSKYKIEDFMKETGGIVDSFVDAAKKAGYIPEAVANDMKNYSSMFDDYYGQLAGLKTDKNGKYSTAEIQEAFKKAGLDYEAEMSSYKDLLFDIVTETDFTKPDAVQKVHERMQKHVGSMWLARIDNRNLYRTERQAGTNESRAIARTAYNLSQDEAAYTLNDSNVLWGGERRAQYAYGVEEERENNNRVFSSTIQKAVGGNLNLEPAEEYTTNDVNANPVFIDKATGDKYKIISEDGETYSIVKQLEGTNKWQTVKTVDGNEIKEENVRGGNTLQYQIQTAQDKQNGKEQQPQEPSAFSTRYSANSKTSEVLDEIKSRDITPPFYESFWRVPFGVNTEEKFENWWRNTKEQKRQEYLEFLRNNYPGRYNSFVNSLNQ